MRLDQTTHIFLSLHGPQHLAATRIILLILNANVSLGWQLEAGDKIKLLSYYYYHQARIGSNLFTGNLQCEYGESAKSEFSDSLSILRWRTVNEQMLNPFSLAQLHSQPGSEESKRWIGSRKGEMLAAVWYHSKSAFTVSWFLYAAVSH